MKSITKRMIALAGVLALGLTAAKAQSDGALLDALVKKGVLSDQEAEDIRASEAKDYSTTAAGKLTISDHITNLKLYGDARMRFEYIDEKPQITGAGNVLGNGGSGPHSDTTERYRYRLRIGADYTFTDNFKAGFELESGSAADSANQSMGSEFGKFNINIGLVYLQWKPVDFLTLTGGKQRNPLYTTDLVWDPDINPEGGSEVASWTFPIGGGSSDPKSMGGSSDMSLTVGLTAAQFIYADNNEYNVPATPNSGVAKTDIWMFVEQVPVQFNFDKDTFVKVVPGFMSYTGGGFGAPSANNTGLTAAAVGNNSSVTFNGNHAANDLNILLIPGEVDWKLWNLPMRAYWDFAYNTQGKDRVQNVYLGNGNLAAPTAANLATQAQNRDLSDNIAWLAGLQVGQNKKKGDWSVKGDFRQIGLGAVDPNINDSDFGDSYLNQQGIKLQSTYNFTDFVTGSITFFDTWAYKSNLLNGTTGNNPAGLPITTGAGGLTNAETNLVGIHSSQRVQVDLVWKF